MTRRAALLFIASVVLWAAGSFREIQVFQTLACLGFGALVVGALLWLQTGRSLRLTRRASGQVRQNEPFTMAFDLEVKARFGQSGLLLEDQNPALGEEFAPLIWVSGVGPAMAASFEYHGVAQVRGEHELGPVEIEVHEPLGLFRRRRRLACPGQLLVLPRWEPVSLLPCDSRRRSYLVGAERATTEGQGSELSGVRPYSHGDDRRRVHWRATARRQQLMVRQFENESRPNLAFFIDTSLPENASAQACRPSLDRAIGVACSLALDVLDTGSRVRCFAPGSGALPLQGGEIQRQRVLHFLARLDFQDDAPAAEALTAAMGQLAGADTLVAVLPSLTSDHASVLSAFACTGSSAVVFLVGGEGPSSSRRWWQRHAPERRGSAETARLVEGLRFCGVPVVEDDAEGSLDRSIQAWLR